MPGLRFFRSLRPPFVARKIGPSLAKIPLDVLLTLTASGARWSERYDAVHSHEEGGLIGVVARRAAADPAPLRHAFEPAAAAQQFRVHRLAADTGRVSGDRAPDDPPLARGDRDLPVARGHRAQHRCGAQPCSSRTRRDRPRIRRRPRRRQPSGAISALASVTPVVLYTGTFEAYQGLDLLFAAMALVRASRADARLVLAGGKPDQVDRCARTGAGRRHRGCDGLRRRTPGQRNPRIPAGGRRARVAAVARDQHTTQNLPVSALGQTHRRHAPPDAHAGARR